MIRAGRPADWPRLRAIQASTLTSPWPDLLETGLDGPPLVLVIEPAAVPEPIGYALAILDDTIAYVAEFAIAPEHQGQGHGSTLLAVLLDRCARAGIDTVRLTARADHEAVHEFYRRQGFAVIDRISDHYEQVDGLLFERSL